MSVTPALRAGARSAYRDLLRASASTFHGRSPFHYFFHGLSHRDSIPTQHADRSILATMLRRNVVQARRTQTQDGDDAWNLRFTKDTELGENESIKNPPPMPSSRRARRLEKSEQSVEPAAQHSVNTPRNFSALKKAHKERKIPELREEDIEESFVRGSGPGGQSINKTQNNVQLLHKPTGFRVACQETRSLQTNRMLARLDKLHNPGLSKGELQRAKQQERNVNDGRSRRGRQAQEKTA
ncbi:RF-1 domain-containing protein [Suillus lakei]|nr:RF-1 domain-containing protein [Suillus lakei]